MRWAAGKDSSGKVPLLEDGLPVCAFSDCGRYQISRAKTPRGYLSDAWLLSIDSNGRRQMPTQLAGGKTGKEAVKICEVHANGHSS